MIAAMRMQPAYADIWGFVDENGRAHMASEKLDDRYTLFFKGAKRVGGPSAASGDGPAVQTKLADKGAVEAFKNSALYRKTTSQMNVKRFEPLIEKAAREQRVDPALVKAVVAVESSFQPDAISPKGARGLMQVIPDTAERYGVVGDRKKSAGQKLLDPATNLRVGITHLSNLLSMFASNLELALAAYNAGEGAVLRYAKKIPPFPETQEYVKLVKQFYASFLPDASGKAATMQLAMAAQVTVPSFAMTASDSDAQLTSMTPAKAVAAAGSAIAGAVPEPASSASTASASATTAPTQGSQTTSAATDASAASAVTVVVPAPTGGSPQ